MDGPVLRIESLFILIKLESLFSANKGLLRHPDCLPYEDIQTAYTITISRLACLL